MFALIVTSKEALASDRYVMTKAGDRFWVLNEPEGWVEATSTRFVNRRLVPGDLKLFKTVASAERFAKRWRGHPWWCQPDGKNYEVVSVTPVTETRIVGYKVT